MSQKISSITKNLHSRTLSQPPSNLVLDILPNRVYRQLKPHLKLVYLNQLEILHLAGETIRELYFPIDCLLSVTITMSNGSTAEAGLAGNRDVLGVNAFMSENATTQTEYIVQISGRAFKIDAPIMRSLFRQSSELQDVMLGYTQALIAQMAQNTGCNRLHCLEQRLARWLLEAKDRVNSNKLDLTHEFISNMLGVRRAGVSLAAQKLQDSNIIQYTRGHIKIIDPQKLEDNACECFRAVKEEYNRLLTPLELPKVSSE